MLSVRLFDRTNLAGAQKAIEKAAEKGVKAAVEEGVEWIKGDVIREGSYVGHQNYPDVTAATKRIKAKKGKTKVLIDTSNYLSSWDGTARKMEGIISGGGGASSAYSQKLYARGWRIDKLFMAVHKDKAEEIIKKAIENAI